MAALVVLQEQTRSRGRTFPGAWCYRRLAAVGLMSRLSVVTYFSASHG